MAKVLGESGRYVSQEATNALCRLMTLGFVVVGLISAIGGFMASLLFRNGRISIGTTTLMLMVFLLTLRLIWTCSNRKLKALDGERMRMRKGADGETLVAITLESLPDEFQVIHDISTSSGNLDHVVVGPTGVFIIDTKSWRGIVAADGNGELLLNDKPTDKPYIRRFIGRMMGTKDQFKEHALGLDPYFRALFVFTAASVKAKWGTTREVHCLQDDQLIEYITDEKWSKKLSDKEVDTPTQAFLSLAQMEEGFDEGLKDSVKERETDLRTAQVVKIG